MHQITVNTYNYNIVARKYCYNSAVECTLDTIFFGEEENEKINCSET